jgi:hypothetical protein
VTLIETFTAASGMVTAEDCGENTIQRPNILGQAYVGRLRELSVVNLWKWPPFVLSEAQLYPQVTEVSSVTYIGYFYDLLGFLAERKMSLGVDFGIKIYLICKLLFTTCTSTVLPGWLSSNTRKPWKITTPQHGDFAVFDYSWSQMLSISFALCGSTLSN